VLAGLDYGARDLEDAVALARQAQADGFELICATLDVRHDHDVRIEELAGRVAELNGWRRSGRAERSCGRRPRTSSTRPPPRGWGLHAR
jgi:tyrosine-protein phosphatase YwqE